MDTKAHWFGLITLREMVSRFHNREGRGPTFFLRFLQVPHARETPWLTIVSGSPRDDPDNV